MEEKTLLKISLVIGSLGLLALAILVMLQPERKNSYLVSEEGDKVTVSGTVTRTGGSLITIRTDESLTVVVFGNLTIKKGDRVKIIGRIETYQGEKQVLADKVLKG